MSSSGSTPPPGWSVPQPPPPPADRPSDTRGPISSAIAWLLVAVVGMLPLGIAFVRARDLHPESYAIGAAFGTGVLIVAGAAILRAIHTRATARVEPAPVQAFLAIAAVGAIGVQFVLRTADGDRGVDKAVAMMRECRESDPTAFGAPPAGMQLVELSPAERAAFNSGAGATLPSGMGPEELAAGRLVDARGQLQAVVVGVPGVGLASDAEKQQFISGVISSQGTPPSEQMVGGIRVISGATPMGQVAVGQNGCWIDMALTQGGGDVVSLASPLFRG